MATLKGASKEYRGKHRESMREQGGSIREHEGSKREQRESKVIKRALAGEQSGGVLVSGRSYVNLSSRNLYICMRKYTCSASIYILIHNFKLQYTFNKRTKETLLSISVLELSAARGHAFLFPSHN